MRVTAKYFVTAAAAINKAERIKKIWFPPSALRSHRTTAHTQNASIIMSDMTVVLETMKTGQSSVARAAISGSVQKRNARKYVPKTAATAGTRKARCSAAS